MVVGITITTVSIISFWLYCCCVMASEDDDKEGRG